MFSPEQVRKDFPILSRTISGHPLIYLDNAATTQLPCAVLGALEEHYSRHNANVHRGIHTLSEESTHHTEAARAHVASFLHAAHPQEIVFTGGATDSLHLVSLAFSRLLKPGDEVITTQMEHHSNFVPWQQACLRTGATFRVVPLTDSGELDLDTYYAMLSPRTKLVAVTQVSNVLGTVNPLSEMAKAAHAYGAAFLTDGAQGVRHEGADVQAIDCDFYCFSGHKIMAPTGIGVLYGKAEWLERLQPVRYGGGMVDTVTEEYTTFEKPPYCWEAGTPNYAGAIALSAALTYLEQLGLSDISAYEASLTHSLCTMLEEMDGIDVLGHPGRRGGVVSFSMPGVHPFDAAALLDKLGVAVRSGTHCAQPLLARFGLTGTIRVSPAFYNTEEELQNFRTALLRVQSVLQGGN